MEKEEGKIMKFIKENWAIFVFLAGLISFYALTNYRLAKAEEAIAQYPSEDYFELKFQTLDKQVADLTDKVEDLTAEIK